MFRRPNFWWEWPVFLAFWLGGVFTVYYELYFVLAHYYGEAALWSDWGSRAQLAIMAYLAFNIVGNMAVLVGADVACPGSGTGVEADQSERKGRSRLTVAKGWSYCDTCRNVKPPRAHHCKMCDQCVLKRHHHCWFAATCIGYKTHRHFIALLFHCSVAGLYACAYNWPYFLHVMGGFGWSTLPSLYVPYLVWMLGFASGFQCFITTVTSISFLYTLSITWMLGWELYLLKEGQLEHENAKGDYSYSLGWRQTLDDTFGSAGLAVLAFPFVRTKFPGDGAHYGTKAKLS